MDILFLGYSSLVQRKVLPAALKSPLVSRIHVASSRQINIDFIPENKKGFVFQSYDEAINKLKSILVYISMPNAMHSIWAEKALEKNHHVIVDKPAFTSIEDAVSLVNLASRKKKCLAEANVWYYHPMVNMIQELISNDTEDACVIMTFTSPPLNPSNFRYNPKMGSGILFDRGSYVVTTSRKIFGLEPNNIYCHTSGSKNIPEIDIHMTAMYNYPNNSNLISYCSLDSEYSNSLKILTKKIQIEADRVFTPPVDQEMVLKVTRQNKKEEVLFPASDTFQLFIEKIISDVKSGNFSFNTDLLLSDAQEFEKLKNSSRRG